MSKPVPSWAQLPGRAQTDLSGVGVKSPWFDKQTETIRLTLLNLYVKLSMVKLWQHVKLDQVEQQLKPEVVELGKLHFQAKNVVQLKQELGKREDFGTPESSARDWSSSEKKQMRRSTLNTTKGGLMSARSKLTSIRSVGPGGTRPQ
jgi:hypothetical protein